MDVASAAGSQIELAPLVELHALPEHLLTANLSLRVYVGVFLALISFGVYIAAQVAL